MYTRIQDRSVDDIAARANQYLEGESGAEEFRDRLLRAIAQGDEDALIFLAKAHRRQRRRDGLKDRPSRAFGSLKPASVPRALSLLAAPAAAQWDHGFSRPPAWLGAYGWGLNGCPRPSGRGQRVSRSRGRIFTDVMELS